MSCSCDAKTPIVAALDTLFESEADGSPARHWLPPETWTRFCGARNVQHYVSVLGLSGTSPSVSFVAQGSIDGKSWFNIEGLTPDAIDAVTTTTPQLCVLDDAASFAPLVRLGVQVEGSANLAGARVTWLVIPDFATSQPILEASSGVVTNPTASDVLVGPLEVLASGKVSVAATASASGSVKLQTSRSQSGGTWYDVQGGAIALTGSNSESLHVQGVLRYVRLVAGSTFVGTVEAELVVRAE